MSSYFDLNDDEEEFTEPDQALVEEEEVILHDEIPVMLDSPRKRLEQLMEERRLRDELEDFLDK